MKSAIIFLVLSKSLLVFAHAGPISGGGPHVYSTYSSASRLINPVPSAIKRCLKLKSKAAKEAEAEAMQLGKDKCEELGYARAGIDPRYGTRMSIVDDADKPDYALCVARIRMECW